LQFKLLELSISSFDCKATTGLVIMLALERIGRSEAFTTTQLKISAACKAFWNTRFPIGNIPDLLSNPPTETTFKITE